MLCALPLSTHTRVCVPLRESRKMLLEALRPAARAHFLGRTGDGGDLGAAAITIAKRFSSRKDIFVYNLISLVFVSVYVVEKQFPVE